MAAPQFFGIPDKRVTDAQVADYILDEAPPHTYSSIKVRTTTYRFPNTCEDKKVRMIHVRHTSFEYLRTFFGALFKDSYKPINVNRVVQAILQLSANEEEKEKDLKILEYAAERNCEFEIYVSTDISDMDLYSDSATKPDGKPIYSDLTDAAFGTVLSICNKKKQFQESVTDFFSSIIPKQPEEPAIDLVVGIPLKQPQESAVDVVLRAPRVTALLVQRLALLSIDFFRN